MHGRRKKVRRHPGRGRERQCAAAAVLVGTASIDKIRQVLAEYLTKARLQADPIRATNSEESFTARPAGKRAKLFAV